MSEYWDMSTYTARRLVDTPGNITTFLRGDNTFTNILGDTFKVDLGNASTKGFMVTRDSEIIWLGIAANNNAGLYSDSKSKWIVYIDNNSNVILNGNANTATKLSNTPNDTTKFLRGDNTWTNVLTAPYITDSTTFLTFEYLGLGQNGHFIGEEYTKGHIRGTNSAIEIITPNSSGTASGILPLFIRSTLSDNTNSWAPIELDHITTHTASLFSTTATAAASYATNAAIVIREALYDSQNHSTDINYAPRIGFVWNNVASGSLALHNNNEWYLVTSNGTTQGRLHADITGTATHATHAEKDYDGINDIRNRYVKVFNSSKLYQYATDTNPGIKDSSNSAYSLTEIAKSGNAVGVIYDGNNPDSATFVHIISLSNDDGSLIGVSQLAFTPTKQSGIWYRTHSGNISARPWIKLLDTSNFNSYAPALDGTGATGTWAISITGSAGSVAWTNVSSKPKYYPGGATGLSNETLYLHNMNTSVSGLPASMLMGIPGNFSTSVSGLSYYQNASYYYITVSHAKNINFSFRIPIPASGVHSSQIYYRTDISGYSVNTNWHELITSENISSQTVAAAGSLTNKMSWNNLSNIPTYISNYASSGVANSIPWGSVTDKPNRAGSASDGGPASYVTYQHTNEMNFKGGMQNKVWFNYRNAESDAASGSDVTVNYYFGNYNQKIDGTVINAGKVINAYWNDYAEYRATIADAIPGQVVIDKDDGTMEITSKRLQPSAQIISDTWGHCMGESDTCKTPIAVAGRVLAIPYQAREQYHAGMAVCSAPNGTIDIMTREEIINYPDCIIGFVSEIPQYETWGTSNIKINNRIWVKLR